MTFPAQGAGDFTASTAITPADVLVAQDTATVVGPLTTVTLGPVPMASPAYAIAIDALINAGATLGILRALMTWTDPVTGLVTAQEEWYFAGTTISPAANNGLTIGRGPTKAGSLTVAIRNFDPVQSATIDCAIWQSSRIVTRDDWRGLATGGGYVGYQVPNSECAAGVLGWENTASIAATSATSWLCALYAGAATFAWTLTAAANTAVGLSVPLADRAAAAYPNIFPAPVGTATGQLLIPLPRCPVVVTIANNSGAAITAQWSLSIQEFAS